jgi:predicted heme/steroid binding protein
MADTLVEAKELIAKYSIEDVAKHNTSEDCWIIIKGRVYDVTNFLDDHPGGPSVLADAAGTDATEQFERAGHPANVQKTMDKNHIGIIEAATTNSDSSATTATSDLLAEKEIKKEFDAKKGGWDRFRDWTDRNPFVWYVVASGIVLMAAWIAAGKQIPINVLRI